MASFSWPAIRDLLCRCPETQRLFRQGIERVIADECKYFLHTFTTVAFVQCDGKRKKLLYTVMVRVRSNNFGVRWSMYAWGVSVKLAVESSIIRIWILIAEAIFSLLSFRSAWSAPAIIILFAQFWHLANRPGHHPICKWSFLLSLTHTRSFSPISSSLIIEEAE